MNDEPNESQAPRPPRSLEALPPPPPGRSGWPWDRGDPTPPAAGPADAAPLVTVVTPSFNQAGFIEETIRSILLQSYPRIEYLVIDGGSADGTVAILEKYSPWIESWVSEPDRGQGHAINKGMNRARGEVVAWLNSDDVYPPGALAVAVPVAARDGWVAGAVENMDVEGAAIELIPPDREPEPLLDAALPEGVTKPFQTSQPAHFWRRDLWNRVGGVDERYRYRMDYDWMIRALAAGFRPTLVPDRLARFRFQPESKTVSSQWAFDLESALVFQRLSEAGMLRRRPAAAAARYYRARGLKSRADLLAADGRRWAAAGAILRSWILSRKVGGGDHRARLARIVRGDGVPAPVGSGDEA